jgi:hypothetical protein
MVLFVYRLERHTNNTMPIPRSSPKVYFSRCYFRYNIGKEKDQKWLKTNAR